MSEVIIIAHLLIVAALIGVVLLQRSEGGGLGMGGGVSGFLTSRGKANVLTRTTAILGALFFITSLALAFLATPSDKRRSILDMEGPAPVETPSPAPSPQPAQPQAPISK